MARSRPLTDEQKEVLRRLEPALMEAAVIGDYGQAKELVTRIQNLLRPTGHETRLMEAKNWFFEAALATGRLQEAKIGFIGVRQKTSKRTRVNLEATALLAICYIREGNLRDAEPLMAEVLNNDKNIKSDNRRREFRRSVIQRFDEEGALTGLQSGKTEELDVSEVNARAIELVRSQTEDQIYANLADSLPPEVVSYLLKVDMLARKLLPSVEVKYLPPPPDAKDKRRIGRTVVSSIRRVIWRSLCDPESEIYKLWSTKSLELLFDRKYLTAAVVTTLSGMSIGYTLLAASTVALVMKLGIEIYCDRFRPDGIMAARTRR
jgi:hypothetical protein